MSLFNVQINFNKTQLANNFLNNVSLNVAEAFSQDIENISGSLIEDCNLLWSGTDDPAIYMVIQSVQILDEEFNRKCAETISKCLTQASGVPESRVFINFVEKVPSDVAVSGSLLWQST